MGLFDRIARAFGSSEKPPGPAQVDDQQVDLLQQVRRGAAEVAVSRRALAQQISAIVKQLDSMTITARRAVEQGQTELAREALARKQGLAAQLTALEAQHDQLQREEERLVITSTRLQAKLDAIRARQHSDGARLAAAEAQQRVQAAFEAVQESQASVAATDALLQAPEPVDQSAAAVAAELAAIQTEVAQRGAEAGAGGEYHQPGQAGGQIQDEWGER